MHPLHCHDGIFAALANKAADPMYIKIIERCSRFIYAVFAAIGMCLLVPYTDVKEMEFIKEREYETEMKLKYILEN